ncbi:hypothetical protein TYRP_004017 [Tyrophagus putrescentiae]|nr:hypothetical protein TYRP_004017 [Tyrophagus putrescentiae]
MWSQTRSSVMVLQLMAYCYQGEVGVEPVEDGLDGAVVLKEYEDERQRVEDADAKDEAPEGGVRPREGPIGKGEQRDDEEEEENAAGRRPEVPLVVGVIAGEGGVEDGEEGGHEEGDGVRLVEELQRDVVHRPLVDCNSENCETLRGKGSGGPELWGAFE